MRAGQASATQSALQGAFALGLLEGDIWDAMLALDGGDFVKSMTTHKDHRVWQDVYHAQLGDQVAYVKIQYKKEPEDEVGYWVMSFKDR